MKSFHVALLTALGVGTACGGARPAEPARAGASSPVASGKTNGLERGAALGPARLFPPAGRSDVIGEEVEPDGSAGSRPVRDSGGQPAWFAPAQAGPFFARLGGNTGYVIHPEETIADNVAFLLSGRQVRNRALLERIGSVLRQEP